MLRASTPPRGARRAPFGKADHGNRLWLLLSGEVWYRMYLEGRSVEDLEAEIGAAA